MASVTDEKGQIYVTTLDDIPRPPYFGTPENPQNWIIQYIGAFVVGGLMQYGGSTGYGWGNYIQYAYGTIL